MTVETINCKHWKAFYCFAVTFRLHLAQFCSGMMMHCIIVAFGKIAFDYFLKKLEGLTHTKPPTLEFF